MNKPATIVLSILVTLAILAGLSGTLHLAWMIDDCEAANGGHRCHLVATPEQRP